MIYDPRSRTLIDEHGHRLQEDEAMLRWRALSQPAERRPILPSYSFSLWMPPDPRAEATP